MTAASDPPPVLAVEHASKSFGAISALHDVSLQVGPGEVLALLGDNGAGKSTLVKALSGVHQLDSGQIVLDGEVCTIRSPVDARALGIETVFQDLSLFDNLTSTANFFIGRERLHGRWLGRLGILDERRMRREWYAHLEGLGVRVKDLTRSVGLMSGGQRQAVAVARAVVFAKRVVILDEPTAALGLRESGQVLDLVGRLSQQGISVILISHNLEQVMQVADRAVVLQQGRKVGELAPTPDNHERIVSLIVGARTETGEQATTGG